MSENLYTPELAAYILEKLANGVPLAVICREPGMPSRRTVGNWRKAHADFDTAFGEARDDGYDVIASRIRATARGKNEDNGGDSTGDVQRDKLIVDTDLKLLAKWDPRRYGDRVSMEHSGHLTLEQLVEQSHKSEAPASE